MRFQLSLGCSVQWVQLLATVSLWQKLSGSRPGRYFNWELVIHVGLYHVTCRRLIALEEQIQYLMKI